MSLRTLRLAALAILPLAAFAAAEPANPLADFSAKALADVQAGKAEAAAECEVAISLAKDIPRQVEGAYWGLLRSAGDYPRGYRFFTGLARERPDDVEAVACAACATGAYIGWMYQHGLGALVTADLYASAEDGFAKALKLDPENFSALFGLTIYDAKSPMRRGRAHDDLARLEAAATKHPQDGCAEMVAAAKQVVAESEH
jgi:hypothetical protein